MPLRLPLLSHFSLALLLLAGTLFSGCGNSQTNQKRAIADPVPLAQKTLQPFKAALMRSLTSALAADSSSAIQVCKVRAPFLADSLSLDGVQIGRTSHKLRNKANSPREWMKPFLQSYVDGNTSSSEWKELADGQIGYVEPIFVQTMCLTCHGVQPARSVASEIETQYPDDEALGFEEGDFRGLFWVILPAHELEENASRTPEPSS